MWIISFVFHIRWIILICKIKKYVDKLNAYTIKFNLFVFQKLFFISNIFIIFKIPTMFYPIHHPNSYNILSYNFFKKICNFGTHCNILSISNRILLSHIYNFSIKEKFHVSFFFTVHSKLAVALFKFSSLIFVLFPIKWKLNATLTWPPIKNRTIFFFHSFLKGEQGKNVLMILQRRYAL